MPAPRLYQKKPQDIWSARELTSAMNTATGKKVAGNRGGQIITDLRLQLIDAPQAVYKCGEQSVIVPADALIEYIVPSNGNCTGFALKEEYGKKIVAAYVAKQKDIADHPKPKGFWGPVEFTDAIRKKAGPFASTAVGNAIIGRLRKQFREDKKLTHAECEGVKVPREAIATYKAEHTAALAYAINATYGQKIADAMTGRFATGNKYWHETVIPHGEGGRGR